MWPFKRKVQDVEVGVNAYERWVRAHKPPFDWFMRQTEEVQQALAEVGHAYDEDICIGIGYAVQSPQVAEAGLDATTNSESEMTLLEQIVGLATSKARSAPAQPASPTMGGIGERRKQAESERRESIDQGRSLFGRKPDSARETNEPAANGAADQA